MSQKVGSGTGRRTPLSLTASGGKTAKKTSTTVSPMAEEAIKRSILNDNQPFVDLTSEFLDIDNSNLLTALNDAELSPAKNGTTTNTEAKVKDSPKVKESPKTKEKSLNGNNSETNGKHSDNKEEKMKESPRQKPAKQDQALPTPSPKKSEPKSPEINTSVNSLALEKDLKGFNADGVEMESILIAEDDDLIKPTKPEASSIVVDSPRPNKTPGKVVKLSKGARMSPFKKLDSLDDVSTVVNLSTVSEQSLETNAADSPIVEPSAYSTRRITSRKTYSSRPLREISFRNAHLETYRKIGAEFDGNDSVNVTVGSELNHTIDSPIVGQKRRAPDDESENAEEEAPAKRGLFRNYCNLM